MNKFMERAAMAETHTKSSRRHCRGSYRHVGPLESPPALLSLVPECCLVSSVGPPACSGSSRFLLAGTPPELDALRCICSPVAREPRSRRSRFAGCPADTHFHASNPSHVIPSDIIEMQSLRRQGLDADVLYHVRRNLVAHLHPMLGCIVSAGLEYVEIQQIVAEW